MGSLRQVRDGRPLESDRIVRQGRDGRPPVTDRSVRQGRDGRPLIMVPLSTLLPSLAPPLLLPPSGGLASSGRRSLWTPILPSDGLSFSHKSDRAAKSPPTVSYKSLTAEDEDLEDGEDLEILDSDRRNHSGDRDMKDLLPSNKSHLLTPQ